MDALYIIIFVSLFLCSWIAYLIYRNRQIHFNQQSLALLKKLYQPINGNAIAKAEQNRLKIQDTKSFVYGEIIFTSFSEILAATQPQAGETFFDLGSGTGKAVLCAAACYSWQKCVGVEILPALVECSRAILKKLNANPHFSPIEFIQQDIQTIDLSSANVVFINATAFFDQVWANIVQQLHSLTIGARVILTSKTLESADFILIDSAMYPMSWGMNSVFIYQKIK